MNNKRAPVQADTGYWLSKTHPARPKNAMPAGTISWEEHLEAHKIYVKEYGGHGQSAERIAERNGFSYAELCMFLGHAPKTWNPLDE